MDYTAIMQRVVSLATQFGTQSAAYDDERLVQHVKTLQDYIHMVGTVVHQKKSIVQSSQWTPSYENDVVQYMRAYCETTNRPIPKIAVVGMRKEPVLEILLKDTGTVEGIPEHLWRSMIAQLLIWLITHENLYPWLQHMAATMRQRQRQDGVLLRSDVRRVLGAHMLLSFEYAADQMEPRPDVPWRWQEPLLMDHYVTALHDLWALDPVYAALQKAPDPHGRYALSQDTPQTARGCSVAPEQHTGGGSCR